MSVYHRVEEVGSMDSGRFCRLARLLPVYGGAVANAFEKRRQDAETSAPVPVSAPVPAAAVRSRPASTPMEIGMSPHADLFSFGGSGG